MGLLVPYGINNGFEVDGPTSQGASDGLPMLVNRDGSSSLAQLSYSQVSGTPTLGSAAYLNANYFQIALTVTTTGTSGPATLNAGVLNIPQYAGTTYTFSTGLTNTTGTVTVNTSQNISTLSNLTSNGFVKTTGGTGALSVDTNTYVNTTTLGANNGVATLDSNGKLTSSQIPSSLVGAVVYQGTWNANTNSPTLASGVGTKGFYYKVSVAGSTSIDGISQWNIGDTIIFDGTVWDKIDGISNEVVSVAGRTGAVTLTLADIGAGTNTAALLIGTGGTLGTSGSGTITATNITATSNATLTTISSLTTVSGGTFGTAAFVNTGTSAGTVPLLNGVNTWSGQQTFALGTITTSQPLTITETWNASGTTFNGLLMNVTPTASASGSRLIALQNAGTTRFDVDATGNLTCYNASGTAFGRFAYAGTTSYLQLNGNSQQVQVAAGGDTTFYNFTSLTATTPIINAYTPTSTNAALALTSSTWYAGTTPSLLIGATSANFNSAGVGLGLNSPNGFTGYPFQLLSNGSAVMNISTGGSVTSGGYFSSSRSVASNAAFWATAAPYSGGTGTTCFPQWFSTWGSATAQTNWSNGSNNGTVYGALAPSTWTGNFIDCRVASSATAAPAFAVSAAGIATVGGQLTITQAALATGSPTALLATGGAHTTLTASTESIGANFNFSATKQFSTGAITTQREVLFQAPTYGFVGASTITNAATVAISGAPVLGTNATFTNSYALWVQGGNVLFAGTLTVTGGMAASNLTSGTFGAGSGFSATNYAAGTFSSGTFTPATTNGNFQTATNNGAHTLAPPSTVCTIVVEYTNGASAGTITTSGFTKVTGDSFTTTNTNKFLCYITKTANYSNLNVLALQ